MPVKATHWTGEALRELEVQIDAYRRLISESAMAFAEKDGRTIVTKDDIQNAVVEQG